VAACAAALLLAACGGAPTDASAGGPAGKPVAGGTARVIQIAEPRHLDPASVGNAWSSNAFLGNALYGGLMTNDQKTGEVTYKMAKSFTTNDRGATFTLTLRSGLKFSDGTTLGADSVKYNWDRIKDPSVGSSSLQEASLIKSTEVVDPLTLKVTMTQPIPNYAQAVLSTSMNWVASPQALKAGQKKFDANPIGAGPFTLKQWTRQDTIDLAKNPKYWDAPKPYLDRITLRTNGDSNQRINTLMGGGADVAVDTNWKTIDKAHAAGYATDTMALNGGQYFSMNTRRAPFDDVRARKAVAAAVDQHAMNDAVYNGTGKTVDTLFTKQSPFYADIPTAKVDKAAAQKLFDELAADGKPVTFTIKSFPTPENKGAAESIQTQLSTFKNVKVKVQTVDLSEVPALYTKHDYDMMMSSALFTDPEPRLWTVFHGDSRVNASGIDDPQLNEALQTGRTATKQADRKAAYETVQRRLAALVPVLWVTRSAPSAVTAKNVHGIRQYGMGSLQPEELWIQK
jgi:peptide/nickel transport system substrate-binding protein